MFLDGRLSALSLEEKHAKAAKSLLPDGNAPVRSPSPSPSLACIYRRTPTPTIVLDASMTVVEVSDSHLAFSGKTRQSLLRATI
ncbi:hypothetical protein COL922a_014883, partial [Colletotrichum nupharicola]